jgi:ABC-type oligopeptide transport system ATPase subunit
MPPKKQPQPSNEMINFYEHNDVKKLMPQSYNPHFNDTQIKIPFRAGIIGASGSGKTACLLNILSKFNDTFGHIYVVYKASEALYEFLEKKIGAKYINFYTKLSQLPPITNFPNKEKQQLIIFDDQVNEKDQSIIQEWSIRGRKVGAGVSLMYLSQSFFKIPKLVRQQFNYLILLKLSSDRDLHLILSDFSLGVDKKQLYDVYKQSTKEKFNFLKIDLDNPNNNKKFSHNFTDFFEFGDSDSDDD